MQSNSSENCIHPYNVEIFFGPELQTISPKPVIRTIKRIVKWVEKFLTQTALILDYKNKNVRKIFHSSTKLNTINADIDEAFKSTHQSYMTKMKNDVYEYCIVLDVIIEHSIKSFDC